MQHNKAPAKMVGAFACLLYIRQPENQNSVSVALPPLKDADAGALAVISGCGNKPAFKFNAAALSVG